MYPCNLFPPAGNLSLEMEIRKAMRIARGASLAYFHPRHFAERYRRKRRLSAPRTAPNGYLLHSTHIWTLIVAVYDKHVMPQSVMQVTGERTVKVDFPTTPFWLQTAMHDWGFSISKKLWGLYILVFLNLRLWIFPTVFSQESFRG